MNTNSYQPLVTIITPLYNQESYIGEAVQSVLNQTYQNWELILVNDGSTDNSAVIARDYAAKYPRKIYFVEHENGQNKGISASRNLGLKNAKGEFLAFLDSDDVYLPDKLKAQVAILLAQPAAAMLYSSTMYWHSWMQDPDNQKEDWIWSQFGVAPDRLFQPPELLSVFLNNAATVPCMGSLLLRKEAIQDLGGWESSFRGMYEDQVLYSKMASKYPIYVSSGCWDKYRQHPESMCYTAGESGEVISARHTYLIWLRNYLAKHGVVQPTLWKALRNAFFPFRYPFLNTLKVQKDNALQLVKNKVKKYLFKQASR